MTQLFEPEKTGFTLRSPDTLQTVTISYEEYGWNPQRDIQYYASIPCFSAPDMNLLADAVFCGDDRAPLALLLLDYPLEDDGLLRRIADVYGNSCKRISGQRPVVYFVTGLQCKSVSSVLGEVQPAERILTKADLEEITASYAIQEVITFQTLRNDKEAVNGFFAGQTTDMDIQEKIRATITDTLARASKIGFRNYLHHYVYSSKEEGRKLPKQLLLLSAMGAKEYHRACIDDCIAIAKFLNPKSFEMIREAVFANDLDGHQITDVYEKKRLEWAYAYYGWNLKRDIHRFVEVPCYLEPNMQLLADYVFFNRAGEPLLVVLRDTLNLNPDKAFVVCEFYARSFKKATGYSPLILFSSAEKNLLKMGALSGGFDPTNEIMPRPMMEAQVRQVAVTEFAAWTRLLEKLDSLKKIASPQERQDKMLEIVRKTVTVARDTLSNPRFVQEQYEMVSKQNEILEETFWERLEGTQEYRAQRSADLDLLRTVVADKRMSAKTENR